MKKKLSCKYQLNHKITNYIKKEISILRVTRPFYESRVNWVVDPAPPASRRPATEASPAPTPAILMPSSGASSQPPRRQKSRRRRRRKAASTANSNSASHQADLATPAVLLISKFTATAAIGRISVEKGSGITKDTVTPPSPVCEYRHLPFAAGTLGSN